MKTQPLFFLCYNLCLGPSNELVNAPVQASCTDWKILVSALYWRAHQDGLENALDHATSLPPVINPTRSEIEELNNVMDATYSAPQSKWSLGLKLGLAYYTCLDDWYLNLVWTRFIHRSHEHVETSINDHHVILPLWSHFFSAQGNPLYVRDIQSHWRLNLNLVDAELGRNFWVSKRLNLRPAVGLRLAHIAQKYKIGLKGGSFSPRVNPNQDPFSNQILMRNHFKGVGPYGGLSSEWHAGCGFSFYGNFALSLIYGRFHVDHAETNSLAISPFKTKQLLQSKRAFNALRSIVDMEFGLMWSTTFCDSCYCITTKFGYEIHQFFDQNQLFRVNAFIHSEENFLEESLTQTRATIFNEARGSLDTEGLTLTFLFDF